MMTSDPTSHGSQEETFNVRRTATPRTAGQPRGLPGRLTRHLVTALALAAAALAAPAAAAAASPAPAGNVSAATRPTAPLRPAAAARASAPAPRQVALPGLRAAAYTVTLITGDRVRLTAVTRGVYSVTTVPAPGEPSIDVTGMAKPGRTGSMYALPAAADALLSAGRLDKGVFDLTWLASHGDTGPGGHIPVMLRYGGHLAAAALGRAAAALPGARVTGTWPATGTVEVSVAARSAAKFWAALTGGPVRAPRPGAAPYGVTSLAGGLTRVWPAGQAAAAPAQPADGQPLYTVTETITGMANRSFFSLDSLLFGMVGVTGGGADQNYPALGLSCVSGNPCTTAQVTYSVPAGVYAASGQGSFYVGPRLQFADLMVPQLTVAGDTAFTLDMNALQHIVISTPRPSQSASLVFEDYRTLPDTSVDFSLSFVTYGHQNLWVIPSPEPATIGSYHFSSAWFLGTPPVTMSVTAPQHIDLDPTYPGFSNVTNPANGPTQFTRFSGRQTLPLVSVGLGRPQDYTGLDVRGKLVFMGLQQPAGGGWNCEVLTAQLLTAMQEGAAGAIVDTRIPGQFCSLPILGSWEFGGGQPAPNIPFVAIPYDQSATLAGLLASGPVRITVTDSGPAPYLYDLKFYQEARIPADLHYTVTDDQLAEVTTRVHAAAPAEADPEDSVVGANEYVVGGTNVAMPAPYVDHIYVGPASPDVVHWRDIDQWDAGPLYYAYDVFGRSGTSTEDWFAQPEVPGAVAAPADVYQAQPGKFFGPADYTTLCAFCRQGDTFYPLFYPTSAGAPRRIINGGMEGFDPSSIHLYQGSQEIPQTLLLGTYPVYQLPAQPGSYRLTTAYTSQEAPDSTIDTDWQFTSAQPATDQAPSGYACVGTLFGDTSPCSADPLIMLRYNSFPDLTNTITAGGAHQFEVTPFYQAATPPAAITSVKVWTSDDGGTTWQQAVVIRHDGTYTAIYQVPTSPATSPTLSIRVQAADSAGDTVDQTILNATTVVNGH
jgi:hypothetical protein